MLLHQSHTASPTTEWGCNHVYRPAGRQTWMWRQQRTNWCERGNGDPLSKRILLQKLVWSTTHQYSFSFGRLRFHKRSLEWTDSDAYESILLFNHNAVICCRVVSFFVCDPLVHIVCCFPQLMATQKPRCWSSSTLVLFTHACRMCDACSSWKLWPLHFQTRRL